MTWRRITYSAIFFSGMKLTIVSLMQVWNQMVYINCWTYFTFFNAHPKVNTGLFPQWAWEDREGGQDKNRLFVVPDSEQHSRLWEPPVQPSHPPPRAVPLHLHAPPVSLGQVLLPLEPFYEAAGECREGQEWGMRDRGTLSK